MRFYRPQRRWGKVIFSEACVKNFVHGGGHAWQGVYMAGACMAGGMHGRGVCMAEGGVHGRGVCVAGGMHGRGGMCGRGRHAWQGACMAAGACVAGACMAGGVHGRGHVWQGGQWACVAGGMHGRGSCVADITRYVAGSTHPTGSLMQIAGYCSTTCIGQIRHYGEFLIDAT